MTPQVPGIADYRVEAESADLIGGAAQSFAQQLQVQKVGVLAFSFSGGLALLAASDPRYSNSIAWIATVGGYYDLAHVLRFFANGEAVRPDGTVEHLPPHEYGPLIVVYDEVQDFFAPQDVTTAHEAIRILLSDDSKSSAEVAKKLTPAGQEIMQRIYHKQRESFVPALLAEVDKRAGTTRCRVPRRASPVSSCPSPAVTWLRRHRDSADRAALAATRNSEGPISRRSQSAPQLPTSKSGAR